MPQIILALVIATSNVFLISVGDHQSPPVPLRFGPDLPTIVTFSPGLRRIDSTCFPILHHYSSFLHRSSPFISMAARYIKRLVRRSFEPKVPLPPLMVRAFFRDTLTEFVLGELPITKLCFTGPTDCWWFKKQPDPRDAWWALPRPCSQTEILA